jgi:hypothetical protein
MEVSKSLIRRGFRSLGRPVTSSESQGHPRQSRTLFRTSNSGCVSEIGFWVERGGRGDVHVAAAPCSARLGVEHRARRFSVRQRALVKPASTSASDVTSTLQNTPPICAATAVPCSAFMSNRATLTPLPASSSAVAHPRPDAPPVTTAAMEEFNCITVCPSFQCEPARLA